MMQSPFMQAAAVTKYKTPRKLADNATKMAPKKMKRGMAKPFPISRKTSL